MIRVLVELLGLLADERLDLRRAFHVMKRDLQWQFHDFILLGC
jgi:hypothetical protein